MYRVPSLRGVGTRGALFHDASVRTLNALFEPKTGHPFGTELDAETRTQLIGYLSTL